LGYAAAFIGSIKRSRDTFSYGKALMLSIPFIGFTALFLIFVTISFTFRSFSQPLLLLLLVPFSITAVGWGHKIHGFPLNILSLLGIIALIGIMVNDG
jgi:multidrug efflux pump subunit AcrB